MSALPTPQPAFRYTPYIEELHGFFADNHLYFGISTDIIPLVERLHESGAFREQMTSIVQSIFARERRALPAAELLEIVANAVGGPLVYKSSPELNEPLSQLFDFLAAIPHSTPEQKPGEIISFPVIGIEPEPLEHQIGSERDTRFAIPRGLDTTDSSYRDVPADRPHVSLPGPSFRKLLIVAGIGVIVAVILAVVLRPRAPITRPVAVPEAGASTVVHPAKPSAYGPAFNPTPPPARRHSRRKPPVDATQPLGGGSSTQPANTDH